MVSTHVLPQGPPAQQAVASWILALSILAGVALLSLAAYGLHKVHNRFSSFDRFVGNFFCSNRARAFLEMCRLDSSSGKGSRARN